MATEKRSLPSVGALIQRPELAGLPHSVAVEAARVAIAEARANGAGVQLEQIAERAAEVAKAMNETFFRRVINCSGTVLNTGLGRARLAWAAVEAMLRVGSGHSSLEIDLEEGRRGDRQTALRTLLCHLTGAESALVVNNNAAAVMLTLNTLAGGKKVLLSRGQSVEIGGAFRMPDVIRSSGAILVDVGTTNRTRVSDYEDAADSETAIILRCHPSNFVLKGFVEEVSARDLAECAHRIGINMVDDVGSGCLIDTTRFGLPHEPTIKESLEAGADVVTASGDKLLGGPQAGLILGKKEILSRIAKNPMVRAVRIDKLTAAALEATLRLYVEGRETEIPTIRYISRNPEEIRKLAAKLRDRLRRRGIEASVQPGLCEVGGGSLPGVTLPSFRLGLPSEHPDSLARALRLSSPPVIGYISDGLLWLDMLTVDEDEISAIENSVAAVAAA